MSVRYSLFSLLILVTLASGCAEGPFWRAGQYSPWGRNQWTEEEKLADTLFKKKRILDEKVADVQSLSPTQSDHVAQELTKSVQNDPILLIRLHAVKLLGRLSSSSAGEGLQLAAKDHRSDVRLAAIRAVEKHSDEIAVPVLQGMLGSDTNIDVRLEATKALGKFPGRKTIEILSQALVDPDPALQRRATESLGKVTGEDIGPNIRLWQQYVNQYLPETNPANPLNDAMGRSKSSDIADGSDDQSFIR